MIRFFLEDVDFSGSVIKAAGKTGRVVQNALMKTKHMEGDVAQRPIADENSAEVGELTGPGVGVQGVEAQSDEAAKKIHVSQAGEVLSFVSEQSLTR